jgi:hypothetical protein
MQETFKTVTPLQYFHFAINFSHTVLNTSKHNIPYFLSLFLKKEVYAIVKKNPP